MGLDWKDEDNALARSRGEVLYKSMLCLWISFQSVKEGNWLSIILVVLWGPREGERSIKRVTFVIRLYITSPAKERKKESLLTGGLVLLTERTSKSRRYDNKMLALRFQNNDWLCAHLFSICGENSFSVQLLYRVGEPTATLAFIELENLPLLLTLLAVQRYWIWP